MLAIHKWSREEEQRATSAHHSEKETPTMSLLICDFCSSTPIRWWYPTRSFDMPPIAGFVMGSIGNWAACDPCHALIEAQEWDKLRERTLDAFFALNPGVRATREQIGSHARCLHALFREMRQGPPGPIKKE